MPSDPDHVLDAIDGVVEEWETVSADAMRWQPPESKSPDLLTEMGEIFAPLANALTEVLRPLGDTLNRVFDHLTDDDDHPENGTPA
ncbi:hypothetical protein HII36_31450 [Nonomuraea sp. NN258]|uniref:hypothetical protein n=1 Tax=Nonomuraea antri TaxID=2730852 RepID=UPI00156A0F74|nr:hypothetical protein [Nonomuraea antri]NRQ36317.1 hypothetical protein [Nonomuraea antri]